ncbi:MAG: TadE/TadG family type IV pilus assembly protein [Thermoleophilia bacterium]
MRASRCTGILSARHSDQGAAMVEFALVLPVLLVLLLGIIDFGLYFYNDLQLTHVARDAARYASVNDEAGANAAIDSATLVSTALDTRAVDLGSSGNDAKVELTATYNAITPLPGLVGIGNELPINATAIMRRE